MAKTRPTKRAKRKGSDAPLIARRDNSRAAGLEKQVNPLTRELLEPQEAEQQLLHSSVQFAILVQSIKDYAIYTLDKAGRIITWNSGAERIKGYTRDAINARLLKIGTMIVGAPRSDSGKSGNYAHWA